jgi:hypothetical protein
MKNTVLFVILTVASPLWATTYFVKAAGNNGNTGLSDGQAWAFAPGMAGCTSVCGSTTINPGDTIQLNQGDTWRDTLTVGVAGTAGNLITYTNYGSGANPAITGSDVMSGFSNGGSNIWDKTSVTTQPLVVIVNNALGTLKGSRAACTSPGDWFWTANTLSVFSTVDPSGNVQAAQRNFGIDLNNKAYLSLTNLVVYGANNTNIYFRSANSLATGVQSKWGKNSDFLIRSAANSVFVNDDALASQNSIGAGYQVDSADASMTFTNCTAEHNLGDGFHLDGVQGATISGGSSSFNGTASNEGNGLDLVQSSGLAANTNITILNFSSHDNFGNGFDSISVMLGDTGNTNTLISGGSYYNNLTGAAPASGIRFDDNTKNSTVQYALVYGNASGGIVVEAQAHDNAFIYNQAYKNNQGLAQTNAPGANNVFYGNVSYFNTLDGFALTSDSGGGAGTVENNIFFSNGRYGFNSDGSVTDTVDYNVNFGNVTNNYNGISKPTHDINSDPLFVDAATNNFRLKSGSPAIDAGLNLGSTFQLAIDPSTSQPYGTANQNSFGSGWEIGAFVFGPASPTPASIGALFTLLERKDWP